MDWSEIAVENFILGYPDRTDPNFSFEIARKKEFADLKLAPTEIVPTEPGTPLLHQETMRRYISPNTDYKSNILFHSMGSGKTCTSGLVVENFKDTEVNGHIRNRALVLVKNDDHVRNYSKQIAEICTKDVYLGRLEGGETEEVRNIRITQEVRKSYEMWTWTKFFSNISARSDEWKRNEYSNRIIIIDEAHNLNISRENIGKKFKKIYGEVNNFLHLVEDCRVILLTGTPIWDKVREIASLINLIIPKKDALPTGSKFQKRFFEGDKLVHTKDLKDVLRGRISFLQTNLTQRDDQGFAEPWLKIIKVYPDGMSNFQYQNTLRVKEKEDKKQKEQKRKKKGAWITEKGTAIGRWSREAAIFIYPIISIKDGEVVIDEKEGDFGYKAFMRYTVKYSNRYRLVPLTAAAARMNPAKHKLNTTFVNLIRKNLEKYSTKFASIIEKIQAKPNQLVFVYTGDFARESGGGAIQFGAILELFGFIQIATSGGIRSFSNKKRFAIISGGGSGTISTSRGIQAFLEYFNKYDNSHGERCQIIIGSKKISEGLSIRNIQQVHILTPHWNLSETRQALGRVFRVGSHTDLPSEERAVSVYRHVAVKTEEGGVHQGKGFPADVAFSKKRTMDIRAYRIAQKKEIENSQIYRLLKEIAWDCPLNYQRNVLSTDVFGSQRCDYRECNYECDGFPSTGKRNGVLQYNIEDSEIQRSNFDLMYSSGDVNALKEEIEECFHSYFSLPLKALMNLLDIEQGDFNLLLQALDQLITSRKVILNRYGFGSYLKEKGNIYFLDAKIDSCYSYQTALYTEYPLLTKRTSLSDIIRLHQLGTGEIKIKEFVDNPSSAYRTLNYQTKMTLLEWGAVLKNPTDNQKKIRDALQRDIDCYFHIIDGHIIHHIEDCRDMGIGFDFLCPLVQVTGKKKTYKSGKWVYLADLALEKKYVTEFAKQKRKRAKISKDIWNDIPHEFYALDNNKGEFMIRTKQTVGKTIAAQKTKGRKCLTYEKHNVIGWLLDLKWSPDSLPKGDLEKKIRSGVGIHKTGKIVLKSKSGWSEGELRTIYYLMTKGDTELCKILKEWYQKPENKKLYNPIDLRPCWPKKE